MKRRQVIGAVAFGLLLLLGLVLRYVAGFSQVDVNPVLSLAYVAALCLTMFLAFYDRTNFPDKTWDFKPKRGLLYFLLSWLIFPLMMVVDAISGADFTLTRMAVGTLIMSLLIGLAGTFMENVGV
jgi:hypothetical protein